MAALDAVLNGHLNETREVPSFLEKHANKQT